MLWEEAVNKKAVMTKSETKLPIIGPRELCMTMHTVMEPRLEKRKQTTGVQF